MPAVKTNDEPPPMIRKTRVCPVQVNSAPSTAVTVSPRDTCHEYDPGVTTVTVYNDAAGQSTSNDTDSPAASAVTVRPVSSVSGDALTGSRSTGASR